MAASTRTPATGGCAPAGTRALAVVLAALAAAAVWLLAGPVGGVAVDARPATGGAPKPVGIAAVLISSLLAGLAGWALLAVLERLTRRAGAVWTVVAVAVLLLSFGGPLTGGSHHGHQSGAAVHASGPRRRAHHRDDPHGRPAPGNPHLTRS